MTEEERLNQLSNDLNEAHTLVEIARRTLWSAETHPENADEPMDACYHLPCDLPDNVDVGLASTYAAAAAAAARALISGELLP